MTRRVSAVLSALIVGVLVAASPAAHAQAPSDFASEPDKSMAKAQDSFGKGDMKAAAAHIQKAAGYVRNEAGKVAKDAKGGMTKAADELASLGTEVKRGAVKSGDQLKKTFAQVDYARARAWHATAEQAQKTGRDATSALRSAGAGVEGAARWSGAQLAEGTQAAVDGLKKAGRGVRLGAEDTGRFFKGLGDGIADLGRRLSS